MTRCSGVGSASPIPLGMSAAALAQSSQTASELLTALSQSCILSLYFGPSRKWHPTWPKPSTTDPVMAILKLPFKILLFAFLLFVLVAAAQLLFYAYLQSTSSLPQKSELIIVFPGEKERIDDALQLVDLGLGKHLAVINKTKKQLKNEIEKKNGSKKAILLTGKESRSTFEDVYQATQLMRKHDFRTVTLVTASYHMPRALLLFKAHLLGSGLDVELFYHSVKIDRQISISIFSGLFYNEVVKMWGSMMELAGNLVTNRLMYDSPWFDTISDLAHKYLLIYE